MTVKLKGRDEARSRLQLVQEFRVPRLLAQELNSRSAMTCLTIRCMDSMVSLTKLLTEYTLSFGLVSVLLEPTYMDIPPIYANGSRLGCGEKQFCRAHLT